MDEIDTNLTPAPIIEKRRRRRYSREFKARVLAECRLPGASLASVAIKHNLNPNMVQSWKRQLGSKDSFIQLPSPSLAPLPPEPSRAADAPTIRLEVASRQGTIVAHWPVDAIDQSVHWLRSLMQ